MKRDGLTSTNVFAYSLGHFFNDLVAVMEFTYVPWYFSKVVGLSAEATATLSLVGQVVFGLATPVFGVASDRLNTPCGKRMPWFIFGTLLVAPSFTGIFIYPPFVINGYSED